MQCSRKRVQIRKRSRVLGKKGIVQTLNTEEGDCADLKAVKSLNKDDDSDSVQTLPSDDDSESNDDDDSESNDDLYRDSFQSLDNNDDSDPVQSDGDSSVYSSSDEEEEKPSNIRGFYKWFRSTELAEMLKDDTEVLDLSSKILNYFKCGDARDYKSFFEMVDKMLANKSFQKGLLAFCKCHYYWATIMHFAYLSRKYLKPALRLSRIRHDLILKDAVKGGENHWFFKETSKEGGPEVVRCALSILIPYCISLDYLDKMGVLAAGNA